MAAEGAGGGVGGVGERSLKRELERTKLELAEKTQTIQDFKLQHLVKKCCKHIVNLLATHVVE